MNIPKITTIASICFLILSSCSKDDTPTNSPQSLKDEIENQEFVKIIEEHVSDIPKNVQIAIAVIDQENTEYIGIHKKNNVLRRTDNADRIFEIGSITKIFTGICLSKLVAMGQASLTETIQDQFDFSLLSGGDITLLQLANHTSGLSRHPTNIDEVQDFDINNPFAHYDINHLKSYLQNHIVLNAESGTQYQYSNLGMGMLSYILSKKMMTSYEELVQEYIFKPLEMTNSTTIMANVNTEKLAPGHNENGNPVQNWDYTEIWTGTGAIKSSILDMEKFVHKNFKDDMIYNLPQKTTFKTEGESIGLGWHILESDGFRILNHTGGSSGYASYIGMDKHNKRAIIVLSNVSGLTESIYAYKINELGADLLEQISLLR